MVYMAVTAEHARLAYAFGDPLEKVSLQGSLRIGEGKEQPYPPEDTAVLRSVGEAPVVFTGHSLTPVPAGQRVFVFVRHVRASVAINGTPVFAVGGEETRPAFTRSPGNFWGCFVSPGITPADRVDISLQRVAGNSHPYQIELFLGNIHFGSAWELLQSALLDVWWAIPLAALFIVMSVLLVFLSLLFVWQRETTLAIQAAFLAGTYICVSLWAVVGYEVLSLLIPFPMLVLVWETFSLLFSAVFVVLFFATQLTGLRRTIALYIASALLLIQSLVIAMQLLGLVELFVVQEYLHIVFWCMVMVCLVLCCVELKFSGKESLLLAMTFIPPCIISIMDVLFSAFGPATKGIFSCIGFLVAAALQIFLLMSAAYKKMERASRLEREVVESRVAVSLSQIQPHFLYNILTGIQYLCSENPARAERALTDFTMFLRGNLESLSRTTPVPLAQELAHVRHYLALEQLRHGDRLRVEWHLERSDVLVPALSVQPLVENAVRWGMREEGLTVRIATQAADKAFIITVEDNGNGFDPHAPRPPRGNGIGLASIRTRVCDLYGGSLRIDSTPGKGTVAVLMFPFTEEVRCS